MGSFPSFLPNSNSQLIGFAFKKQERLCNKNHIANLFASRNGFIDFPLSLRWERSEKNQDIPVKILIVVSKKNFKKAVDRNKIKRLLRETYRLNKSILYDRLKNQPFSLHLCVSYIGKEIPVFKDLEISMQISMQKVDHLLLDEK